MKKVVSFFLCVFIVWTIVPRSSGDLPNYNDGTTGTINVGTINARTNVNAAAGVFTNSLTLNGSPVLTNASAGSANWTASGTTNSTLSGVAGTGGVTATNSLGENITIGGSTASFFLNNSNVLSRLFMVVAPTNSPASWQMGVDSSTVSSIPPYSTNSNTYQDGAFSMGWNYGAGGGRTVSTEPAIGFVFERSFNGNFEHYLQIGHTNGTSWRPMFWTISRQNSNDCTLGWQVPYTTWAANPDAANPIIAASLDTNGFALKRISYAETNYVKFKAGVGVSFTVGQDEGSTNTMLHIFGNNSAPEVNAYIENNYASGDAQLRLGGSAQYAMIRENGASSTSPGGAQNLVFASWWNQDMVFGGYVANDVATAERMRIPYNAAVTVKNGLNTTTVTATNGFVGPMVVMAKTTNYTLTTLADLGKAVSNFGTSAQVTNTLPSAAAGYVYRFLVEATNGIMVKAATGNRIQIAASQSADGGNIVSTNIGNVVTLCVGASGTNWFAISHEGTWTVN